jgi:hypothetical protein
MTATIVTCFYEMSSKHSIDKYTSWMQLMIENIHNPMVIFCEKDWVDRMWSMRLGKKRITKVIVRDWEDMKCTQFIDYWHKDWERDLEKERHNPRLYILWNEKTAMVEKAIQLNPFDTEFYCWCDIGCFRNAEHISMYRNWPEVSFLESARKDQIYVLNIEPFQTTELTLQSNGLPRPFAGRNRIGGGIILGHRSIWRDWIRAYYETLDLFMKEDYFAGKDQNVMAAVVARYPTLCRLIQPKPMDGFDPWFYLERYFLQPEVSLDREALDATTHTGAMTIGVTLSVVVVYALILGYVISLPKR